MSNPYTTTTHYSLVKPTVGSVGWGGAFNSSQDALDSLLYSLATAPTFSGTVSGKKFVANATSSNEGFRVVPEADGLTTAALGVVNAAGSSWTGWFDKSGNVYTQSVNAVNGYKVNGVALASTHLSDTSALARLAGAAFTSNVSAPSFSATAQSAGVQLNGVSVLTGDGTSTYLIPQSAPSGSVYIQTNAGNCTFDSAGSLNVPTSYKVGGSTLTSTHLSDGSSILRKPSVTIYVSGSGTYTVPAGTRMLHVRMIGGGAGGTGAGATTNNGSGGVASTFGTSFLTATGGSAATAQLGGAGGSALGGTINISGGNGQSLNTSNLASQAGGMGAPSQLGGGGRGGNVCAGLVGSAPGAGGGGGGTTTSAAYAGAGGGAGGYVEHWITSPAASYAYTVGTGGNGGNAGTNGYAGGAGAAGIIIIEAY